jgi:hypothetical protein
MYRVLLKSMNFGAPDNKDKGHDGAAAEARNLEKDLWKQNKNLA